MIKSLFILLIYVTTNLASAQTQELAVKVNATTLVAAARKQIGVTTSYDPSYTALKYPHGDVPLASGVCTDVIIRAMRHNGIDLQKEVHEDMLQAFASYPKNWNLKRTDKNIDHRRVPNLQKYFERKSYRVILTQNPEDYCPGDFVTCLVAGKLPHIMIVSDQKNSSGHWKVIHNIGAGTKEEDLLFSYPLTGHYRWRW